MSLLNEKVALVTGAGNGIGRAVALLLAQEGAKVVVNDAGTARDGTGSDPAVAERVAEEIRERRGAASASSESVATFDGARRAVEHAVNTFGRIDVLVNAAGILRDGPFLNLDERDFDALIDVHLRGTLACTHAAARAMRSSGGGSIVMTTGLAGLTGNFGQASYSAASAGVLGLMRTTCIELQRHAIRVNAVAPIAKTRLTEDLPLFEGVDSMTADHVAPLYLFLASELSRETTGNVFAIAGGRLSAYRMTESAGRFKESGGPWTANEIAEELSLIRRF